MKKKIVIQLNSEADSRDELIIDWLNKQPRDLRGTRIKECVVDLLVRAIKEEGTEKPFLKSTVEICLEDEPKKILSGPSCESTQVKLEKETDPEEMFKMAMKKLEF